MSQTDLKDVLCPGCRKPGLWATTHSHGSTSFILQGLSCPRRSCGWRVDLLCQTCEPNATPSVKLSKLGRWAGR